ncbi:hypothetical protein L9F63_017916, partial [Diploptera punctata]
MKVKTRYNGFEEKTHYTTGYNDSYSSLSLHSSLYVTNDLMFLLRILATSLKNVIENFLAK